MRGLVGLTTMLILVLGVAFPAVARVDQATQRAVDHAQVAVEQGEGDAVNQAIDQAQNTRTVVDQGTLQNGGSTSASGARLLLCVVALLIAGVVLVYRIREQRSKDHTFGGLGSYFRRMQTRGWHEKMPCKIIGGLAASEVVKVRISQRLVGIILVAALAISVSLATPALASGEDAARRVVCSAAYYFYPSYYSDQCTQAS